MSLINIEGNRGKAAFPQRICWPLATRAARKLLIIFPAYFPTQGKLDKGGRGVEGDTATYP